MDLFVSDVIISGFPEKTRNRQFVQNVNLPIGTSQEKEEIKNES